MNKFKAKAASVHEMLRMGGFNRTIIVFSVLLLPFLLVYLADDYRMIEFPSVMISVSRLLITIIAPLLAASVFIRLTAAPFRNSFSDTQIEEKLLLTKAYSFVVYCASFLIILYLLGVSVSNLTIFLGFIATGLAFAVRDILMSYFAWFMLLTKKPFRIGDYIQIKEIEGKVIHIGTFYVLLDDSPENRDDFIRIPNRLFLEHPLFNFGSREFSFKVLYPLASSGRIDLPRISKALEKAVGKGLELSITGSEGGLSIVVSGKAVSYHERNEKRAKIIGALAQVVPFKG